jgi:hypothetical protein
MRGFGNTDLNSSKLILLLIGLLCLGSMSGGCNVGNRESETTLPSWVIGGWRVNDKEGKPITITLYMDGSALSNVSDIGHWYYVDNRVYIVWTNGWTDVIVNESGKYMKLGFAPGVATDTKATNSSKAEKVQASGDLPNKGL